MLYTERRQDQGITVEDAADDAAVQIALKTASRRLHEYFDGRIVSAAADLELQSGRSIPVVVCASVSEDNFYELEKELSEKVFTPVSVDTEVSMTIYLIPPGGHTRMTKDSFKVLYGNFEP